MVEASPRRGTDYIDIVERSQNQENAKLILQSVADTYIENRNDIEQRQAERALATLDDERQKQADLTQEKRTALTRLIQSYGIPYFDRKG